MASRGNLVFALIFFGHHLPLIKPLGSFLYFLGVFCPSDGLITTEAVLSVLGTLGVVGGVIFYCVKRDWMSDGVVVVFFAG